MTDKEEILVAIAELRTEVKNAIERDKEDRLTITGHGVRIGKLENDRSKQMGLVAGISLMIGLLLDPIKKALGL